MSLAVVMPVYNAMPFLPKTVESILLQTHRDFLFYVVDDGSTDGSGEYLESLNDPRIRLVRQNNRGLCATLNETIRDRITAKFIARTDADDISLPGRLQAQYEYLLGHEDYGAVITMTSRIGINGRHLGHYRNRSGLEAEGYSIDKHGFITHSAIMFSRDLFCRLGGYRAEFYPADDLDLTIRLSQSAKIALINKPLLQYRVLPRSVTFNHFSAMQDATRYLLQMRRNRLAGLPEPDFVIWKKAQSLSGAQRLIRRMKDGSKYHYRLAGCLMGGDKLFSAVLALMVAMILNPIYVIHKLSRFQVGDRGR